MSRAEEVLNHETSQVLMIEHSITLDRAKKMLREIIKENVKEFLHVTETNKHNTELSSDLRQYLEAIRYTLKGHAVWCLMSPRYNPRARYNELQITTLEKGAIETLGTWPNYIDRVNSELRGQEPSKQDFFRRLSLEGETKQSLKAEERKVEISIMEIDSDE